MLPKNCRSYENNSNLANSNNFMKAKNAQIGCNGPYFLFGKAYKNRYGIVNKIDSHTIPHYTADGIGFL